jgi:hypothetical protein
MFGSFGPRRARGSSPIERLSVEDFRAELTVQLRMGARPP